MMNKISLFKLIENMESRKKTIIKSGKSVESGEERQIRETSANEINPVN